jgi:hypothetical protein
MKFRYLGLVAVVLAALGAFLFWNGPHHVQGLGQNAVVLCSSCTFQGLPHEGYLVLMDGNSGEIWLYSDAAMEGKENPMHWGKLVLGQPVARVKP